MAIYYMIEPWYKKGGGGIDPVLNNNDWATIQKAAQDGVASQYWSVGDRKAITLNGTVGDKTFSNTTVYAYILGFNHNASVEGNNTIHFQFGFDALSGGTQIAFCDSRYNSPNSGFRMNTSDTNSGGWESSYMRNTIIPAFINAMPSDLQNALKPITKYTNNIGQSSASSAVTATQDKVFLLAEYEIFGQITRSNSYEKNNQDQYEYYYSSGNPKIRYNDTLTSVPIYWWERSPRCDRSTSFCRVNDLGGPGNGSPSYSYGFAPAFVVG